MNDTNAEFKTAQQALCTAAMQQMLTPEQAAISAYVNGILQSARLSALIDLTLELASEPLTAAWTAQERFDSLQLQYVEHMTRLLTEAKAAAPKILLNGNTRPI